MTEKTAAPGVEPKGSLLELAGVEVLEELARSPRGITYRVRRKVEQDIVAVKGFRRGLCSREFTSRLAQNAEASFLLDHPALVRGLGCVEQGSRLLLIMDLAPGEALSRKLKQRLPNRTTCALKIILQCALALEHAAQHKRYHGRLHPADIIVSEDSEVRLLGVGLCERPMHPAWAASDPYLFEPLVYTAPEAMPSQLFPAAHEGQVAADVHALGGILFHLITGAPPFRGRDEEALASERRELKTPVAWPVLIDVCMEVRALTGRMLAPEAALRPGYSALITALKETLKSAEKAEAAVIKPVIVKPASKHVPAAGQAWWEHKRRRLSIPYAAMLAVLTAVLFTAAMTKIYFVPAKAVPPAPSMPPAAVQPPPAAVLPAAPAAPAAARPAHEHPVEAAGGGAQTAPAHPAPPALPASNNAAVAARQLELIEEMLKKGEVLRSPALLKVVRRISESAGPETTAGVKALLLAAEIEDALARKTAAAQAEGGAAPAQPFPAQPASAPPSAAAPGTLPAAPVAAAQPAPPPPPPSAPAKEAAPASGQKDQLMRALLAAKQKAAVFMYDEALASLPKSPEHEPSRELAEGYSELIRQEQGLVQRCRKRLREAIEKSPSKESPLQARSKNIQEDVADFDAGGLVTLRKRAGAAPERRVREWSRVPKAEALNLLLNLCDLKSPGNQAGLASFCFNRGLSAQLDTALTALRGLCEDQGKAAALAALLKELGTLAIEQE